MSDEEAEGVSTEIGSVSDDASVSEEVDDEDVCDEVGGEVVSDGDGASDVEEGDTVSKEDEGDWDSVASRITDSSTEEAEALWVADSSAVAVSSEEGDVLLVMSCVNHVVVSAVSVPASLSDGEGVSSAEGEAVTSLPV